MGSKGNLFKRTLNTRYFGRKNNFYDKGQPSTKDKGKGLIINEESKEDSGRVVTGTDGGACSNGYGSNSSAGMDSRNVAGTSYVRFEMEGCFRYE